MTKGQQRARRELASLAAAPDGHFSLVEDAIKVDERLVVTVSLRLGRLETREGGLQLREREQFIIIVPPDFPFAYPRVVLAHRRFATFSHVIWGNEICLYQSILEWNPRDGLYGFFDRLALWLQKAAVNDMDPTEGPLEPPHSLTRFSERPFVVRADAPIAAGERWLGVAHLRKFPNRVELVGWSTSLSDVPAGLDAALAVILPDALPMEFPQKGSDIFAEFAKQGYDSKTIIRYLGLRITDAGEPVHLVVGLPMRRAADGTAKLHVAVWSTQKEAAKLLRSAFPNEADDETVAAARGKFAEDLHALLADYPIAWCHVLDDRPEIIVRRDLNTVAACLQGKRILILGCGALGSWTGELAARAGASAIDLIDNGIVKPGLLVRQNYRLADIAVNKAAALCARLLDLSQGLIVQHFDQDAITFIRGDPARFASYDLVIDCTASPMFQMKLERDWAQFASRAPRMISYIIDGKAQHCLSVAIPPRSKAGPWDSYVQLKRWLCTRGGSNEVVEAFYSDRAVAALFQPEPGCSDPTFSGSATDVINLASGSLNALLARADNSAPYGNVISAPHLGGFVESTELASLRRVRIADYEVRVAGQVFHTARGWVQQNNRLRSPQHETGGLLWGLWDDAVGVIWVFDASGPPPDSLHDPGHFVCGTGGTLDEHRRRTTRSRGTEGFVGFWHTHPGMLPVQSDTDVLGMSKLVATIGDARKRALMIIFGRRATRPAAGLCIYESQGATSRGEAVRVSSRVIALPSVVV
ncbi:MAG: ThiF family adenylyltransferase [Blastocatellia bacterium]|nr:ThiF family adenylyltransferase [Blastocatellia bacterium]